MSHPESKSLKKKQDFRKLILEAAKELFLKFGFQATSIRKIAAEINISPTTIYLYYKDKSDIIYALHQEGFGMMNAVFSALIVVEDPFERLKALGRFYLKFSFEHPDLYELMFVLKEPMDFLKDESLESWAEGEKAINALISTIADCQKEGYFMRHEPEKVALQVWSSVHGLSSLFITGHICALGDKYAKEEERILLVEEAFGIYIELLAKSKLK